MVDPVSRLEETRWVEVVDRGAAARGQLNQARVAQHGDVLRDRLPTQAVPEVNQAHAQFEERLVVPLGELLDDGQAHRIAKRSEDCIHTDRLVTFWLPINKPPPD